jgi:glucose-6-phosphate-specific signal transduction histidine kinase
MFIWNFLFTFWFYMCGGLLLLFITYIILEWIAETRYISDLYERVVVKRVMLVYTLLFLAFIIFF